MHPIYLRKRLERDEEGVMMVIVVIVTLLSNIMREGSQERTRPGKTSRQKIVCLSPKHHLSSPSPIVASNATPTMVGSAPCYIMVLNKHASRMAACLLLVVAVSALRVPPSILQTRHSHLKKYSINNIESLKYSAISATALHGKLWKRLQIEEGE